MNVFIVHYRYGCIPCLLHKALVNVHVCVALLALIHCFCFKLFGHVLYGLIIVSKC